jgi:hypothetical protein
MNFVIFHDVKKWKLAPYFYVFLRDKKLYT